ncbi:MAG: hypothetical protein LBD59_04715 [Prevotellaceae bacterium]|jgi:hypothetical protein|nr:hypothetical protein [Prevotellaceae bacterium]
MALYYAIIYGRAKGILLTPLKTWKTIKKESGYIIETFMFLFVSCLASGLLSLIKGHFWLAEIYIPFSTILISSIIIRFFKLIKKIDWERNFSLLVYSFCPLIWYYSLSFIIHLQQFLLPMGLIHSFVLLFISIKIFFDVTFLQILSMMLKIILVAFGCLYLLMVFFSG